MRIVIALGGNALLKRGEPMHYEVQRANVRMACQQITQRSTVMNSSSLTETVLKSDSLRCNKMLTQMYPCTRLMQLALNLSA